MSALAHFADLSQTSCEAREVPVGDISSAANCSLFDRVVGTREQCGRNVEVDCLRGSEIDHQIKLHRQVDRRGALENPADVASSLSHLVTSRPETSGS